VCWLDEAIIEFVEERQKYQSESRNTLKGYIKRGFQSSRKIEYSRIVKCDLEFNEQQYKNVKKILHENKIDKTQLELAILNLQSHKNKNMERGSFLLVYASFVAVLVLLAKSGWLVAGVIIVSAAVSVALIGERILVSNSTYALNELEEIMILIKNTEFEA